MANIKSAKKRVLTAAKKRARNKARVSRLRSAVKKYGQADAKKKDALPQTHSEIDRARAKGVIHSNAAARYKSRLAKKAVAASSSRRERRLRSGVCAPAAAHRPVGSPGCGGLDRPADPLPPRSLPRRAPPPLWSSYFGRRARQPRR